MNEKVAMTISGHKTRAVFDRCHIVDTADVLAAMKRAENVVVSPAKNLIAVSERTVKVPRGRSRQKRLTA